MAKRALLILMLALAASFAAGRAEAAMIRELVTLHGAVPLPLEGVGIVTGLAGTGDKGRAAQELLREYLSNNNMNFETTSLALGNIAIVKVTAEVPPFSRPGQRFPVYVSSFGDAKSLAGGVLMQCDLKDGHSDDPVARASGQLVVGRNHLTRGVVPAGQGGGALQFDAYPFGKVVNRDGIIRLNLNAANWADASAIARQINLTPSLNPSLQETTMFAEAAPTEPVAYAKDAGQVLVKIPRIYRFDVARFIGALLDVPVSVNQPARILINRAQNTIVVTGDIWVNNAVISLQDKTVTIRPETETEPAAYMLGPDTPRTAIEIDGPGTYANLQGLIDTLNSMGLNTEQIITIFEQLRDAGAIKAELINQ